MTVRCAKVRIREAGLQKEMRKPLCVKKEMRHETETTSKVDFFWGGGVQMQHECSRTLGFEVLLLEEKKKWMP